MRMRSVLPGLVVGLALACLTGVAAPAADAVKADPAGADAARIGKLIEQLGSDTFADRQAATEALAKVGMPALEALRKAAASKDTEVRKRALELLVKLEKEAASAEVLTPQRVHLVYKGTPIGEAVEDLKKKTGAQVVLHDPENKLKGKKVTLDTGKTTFWDALDRFCAAAGVVEGDPNAAGMPVGPGMAPGGGPVPIFVPGVKIQPAPPVRVPEKAGKAGDKKADAPADDTAKKKAEEGKAAKAEEDVRAREAAALAVKAAVQAKEAAKRAAIARVAVAQPAIGLAQPAIAPGPAMPPGGVFPGMPGRPWVPVQPGQITLLPGKPAAVPTDASSSIRIRLADRSRVPNVPVVAADREIALLLEVSPEPRLRWQSLTSVTVNKAVDDNGAKLEQAENKPVNNVAFPGGRGGVIMIGPGGGPGMPAWIGGPGAGMWAPASSNGLHHYVTVRLKKGDKESKSLKELTGTLAASVLTAARPLISADGLMKAAGKTFKGKTGGQIKVDTVTKNADGSVTVNFEFTQPEGVIAETQLDRPVPFPVNPAMPAPGGPIRIQPAPAPAPAPGGAGAAAPAIAPAVRVRFALAEKPAIAVPAVVPAAPQAGGGVGIAIGIDVPPMAMMNYAPFGLTLRDDKGNVLPASIYPNWNKGGGVRGFNGAGGKMDFVATYRPAKGGAAEPAQLVFTGRKAVNVSIPFTLKGVNLK